MSPDGKRLVFGTMSAETQNSYKTVVCDPPGCASRCFVNVNPLGRPRWTPDGRSVALVSFIDPFNLSVQPVDGGPARQLTHFTDGRQLGDFA
jgi:hypothetical protein